MNLEWTEEEKRQLYWALNRNGPNDLEFIKKRLPNKSVDDINKALDTYKQAALAKWAARENCKKTDRAVNWADIVKRINLEKNGVVLDPLARVLKYIAMYEKRTSNVNVNVNLSDCYQFLSNLSNEEYTKKLDSYSDYFIHKSLITLGRVVRLNGIIPIRQHMDTFKLFVDILDACKDPVKNPLSIPSNLIKYTDIDKRTDVFENQRN